MGICSEPPSPPLLNRERRQFLYRVDPVSHGDGVVYVSQNIEKRLEGRGGEGKVPLEREGGGRCLSFKGILGDPKVLVQTTSANAVPLLKSKKRRMIVRGQKVSSTFFLRGILTGGQKGPRRRGYTKVGGKNQSTGATL